MTTKQALDRAMSAAAGYANRCRVLLDVSKGIPGADFVRLANQHPCTLARDVAHAEQDFQRLKAAYEEECAKVGVPPYATYNED